MFMSYLKSSPFFVIFGYLKFVFEFKLKFICVLVGLAQSEQKGA